MIILSHTDCFFVAIAKRTSALCGDDHEGDSYHGYGDADEDVVGEGFAKDEGAYEDGGDGLEHSQHRGFGGADVACGNS